MDHGSISAEPVKQVLFLTCQKLATLATQIRIEASRLQEYTAPETHITAQRIAIRRIRARRITQIMISKKRKQVAGCPVGRR